MVVRVALEKAGMLVREAGNGRMALDAFDRGGVDLAVLDVGMPDMSGFDCCRAIRAKSGVPILFLTAQDDEIDRVLGFELGADDYVAKPFSPRELALRVKAILARGRPAGVGVLRHGDLSVDFNRHVCMLGGTDLDLTATEFSLIKILLEQPGFVVDRHALINGAYAGNSSLSGRTVDSHIRNIRAKAAALGYADLIETVRGVGLRLGPCMREFESR